MNTLYLIISGLVALVVGYFTAKRQGRKEAEHEQEKQNIKAKTKATEKQKEVNAFSDAAILDTAKKWVRKK